MQGWTDRVRSSLAVAGLHVRPSIDRAGRPVATFRLWPYSTLLANEL